MKKEQTLSEAVAGNDECNVIKTDIFIIIAM